MDKVAYHQTERPSDQQLIHRIVSEVAAREGVEPTDLEPIASFVDVDALEALVSDHANFDGRVSFTYLDYRVTVDSDGALTVSADAL